MFSARWEMAKNYVGKQSVHDSLGEVFTHV